MLLSWWNRSFVVFMLFIIVTLCEAAGKVRLTDVTTLTLYHDKYTTGRRSAPIPQIQCIGGSAKGQFEPRIVQCYNRGYDGIDVQWECKAEMSDQYEFGDIRVSCEGYDYPEDPYILQGSCGLKYKLEYRQGGGSEYQKSKKVPSAPPYEKDYEFGFSKYVTIAIVILCFYVVYKSCSESRGANGTRRSGWGWDQGPPPPPGSGGPPPPAPGFKSFTRPSDAPPTYEESLGGAFGAQSQSSGPGFFSGLGLGGLAGYMYGRSQSGEDSFFRSRRPHERDYGSWGASSSRNRDDSPRPSTSRTASGFGGTERR